MSGQWTAGLVFGGIGGVGLLVGAITGGLTVAKRKTIADNCNLSTKVCSDDAGESAVKSAQATGLASTVGFTAGGIAVAGAAILLITAPRGGTPPSVTATWSAGPRSASFGLRVAF